MPLDMGWIVSVSLAGIVATIGVSSIINIIVGRSEDKNKNTTNFFTKFSTTHKEKF